MLKVTLFALFMTTIGTLALAASSLPVPNAADGATRGIVLVAQN